MGPVSSERYGAASWLVLMATLGIAAAWMARGSLAPWGPFLFLLGVVLFLYFPGALTLELFIHRLHRLGPNPFLALAAGFPAGLATFAFFSRFLPPHGYLALAATSFALVAVFRRQWIAPGWNPPHLREALVGSAAALVLLGTLSLTSYRSVEVDAAGGLSYLHSTELENLKIGGSDAFFHAGVTSALSASRRETMNPFLVGAPLAYHYGMDLLASIFERELSIPALDLAARLMPSLFVLTLSALVYELARAIGLSSAFGLLAVALTFASDFRLLLYLFPLRPEWSARYWLSYFTAYPSTSYYWANPELPALVLLVGGLLVLAKHGSTRGGRLLAGLLLGATAVFKVFVALHVAMVLPLAAASGWLRSRRRDLVWVTGVAAIVMLAVVLGNRGYGGSEVTFRWAFLEPARASFRTASLEPVAEVLDRLPSEPGVFLTVQAAAAFLFYMVMVMGIRVAAVPSSFSVLRRSGDETVPTFLALFFLLGWLPPLVLVVSVSGMNNAFWFTNQSLFVGSLLVAAALSGISWSAWRRAAVAAVLVFALVPTWKDLAFRGAQPQARWSRGELEASLRLRGASEADAVVLHPVNREAPSPASHIAGRGSVLTYWQGYPFSFAPRSEVEARASDVGEFFRTEDPSVARAILEKYAVSWVYAPKARPLRFPYKEVLEEVLRNDAATLYRIKASRARSSAILRTPFR